MGVVEAVAGAVGVAGAAVAGDLAWRPPEPHIVMRPAKAAAGRSLVVGLVVAALAAPGTPAEAVPEAGVMLPAGHDERRIMNSWCNLLV